MNYFSLVITWKSFCISFTLFLPKYSTEDEFSDTNFVGEAKTMAGDSAGTPGLSPW